MKVKVLLPTYLATFWRNLNEGAQLGVEFDVEHQGELYSIENHEGNLLSLVSQEGARRVRLARTADNGFVAC